MVNQGGEPSKDTVRVSTIPNNPTLASVWQAGLHETVKSLLDEKDIGPGPTLAILRNEVSYVESELNNRITLENMLDVWISNFTVNYERHFHNRSNSHVFKGKKIQNSAVVVGAGPSANEYFGIEPLEDYKGTIVCVNKSYRKVIQHGIDPDYCVVLHGTSDVIDSFLPGWVRGTMKDSTTKFVLATSVHPSVADLICDNVPDDRIMWFNASLDGVGAMGYNEVISKLSGLPRIQSGGNVGILSTVLAKNLGAKVVGLFGLEHCLPLDEKWTNEVAYNMEIRYAPEDGLIFAMSPIFRTYVKQLYQLIVSNPEVQFVNLVKNGVLYADRKTLNVPYQELTEFVKEYD